MTIRASDAVSYTGDAPLQENITVDQSTGDQQAHPLWTSQVSSEDFKEALEKSLPAVRLLNPEKDGQYKLFAEIQTIDQPLIGISMTVTASVSYQLFNAQTQKVVFHETIDTSFTVKTSAHSLELSALKSQMKVHESPYQAPYRQALRARCSWISVHSRINCRTNALTRIASLRAEFF